MNCSDRIALVAWLWFAGWTLDGMLFGRLFNMGGTGTVLGFIFALATVFLWPWILPRFIDDWMHSPRA